MGLREQKKEQTRTLIADTAWQLFTDRGFDRVTVAEVAHAAQVSEATVFNYFPSKEDLFYFRLQDFGQRLIAAVDARAEGEPVLDAVQRFLLQQGGMLARAEAGDRQALARLRTVNRMIADSPSLRAREQHTIQTTTAALAERIAAGADLPDDGVSAYVAANALMGVHRALIDYVRRRVLTGTAPTGLAADVREHGARAFALLAHGLAGHGRPPSADRGNG